VGPDGEDTCKGDSGGPLITEELEDDGRALVLVGILHGGGIDCSRLGEEDYQPTQNGIWMKIQAFHDWITTTIFNELLQEPGGWTEWSSWGPCLVPGTSCGSGKQSSRRECTNPRPRNGGADCTGEMFRARDCNTCGQDQIANVPVVTNGSTLHRRLGMTQRIIANS